MQGTFLNAPVGPLTTFPLASAIHRFIKNATQTRKKMKTKGINQQQRKEKKLNTTASEKGRSPP